MRKDWRKIKLQGHPAHLVLVWFHWSWRPRLYICYYEPSTHEQRFKKLGFKNYT